MEKVSKLAVIDDEEDGGGSGGQQRATSSSGRPTLANSPKIYFENGEGRIFGVFKSIAELGVDGRVRNYIIDHEIKVCFF
jgi:hypothetical protein